MRLLPEEKEVITAAIFFIEEDILKKIEEQKIDFVLSRSDFKR
jgi:hypothetical protein